MGTTGSKITESVKNAAGKVTETVSSTWYLHVLLIVLGVVGGVSALWAIAKYGSVNIYQVMIGIQVVIIILSLIIVKQAKSSTPVRNEGLTWEIARASVIYLPISLGMFCVLASVIFENGNFLIPVLGGFSAMAVNFMLDIALRDVLTS